MNVAMVAPLMFIVPLLLGALVVIAILLANKHTRGPAAVVLAVLFGGGLLVVGWSFVVVSGRSRSAPQPYRPEASARVYVAPELPGGQTRTVVNGAPDIQGVIRAYADAATPPKPGAPKLTAEAPEPRNTVAEAPAAETSEVLAKALAHFTAKLLAGPPPPAATPPKPSWVDRPTYLSADSFQMTVVVGPYTSRLECEANLPRVAHRAVDEFVAAYLGREWAGLVQLSPDVIRDRLVQGRWEQPVQASFGPMVQLHTLLVFDRHIKTSLQEQQRQWRVSQRMTTIGTGIIAALLALVIIFAALKIDLATEGRQRRRVVALGILSLALMAYTAIAVCSGINDQSQRRANLAHGQADLEPTGPIERISPIDPIPPIGEVTSAESVDPLATHSPAAAAGIAAEGQHVEYGPPLSPIQVTYAVHQSWFATGIVGFGIIGVGLVALGSVLSIKQHRGAKLLMLAGIVAVAILIAALALIV